MPPPNTQLVKKDATEMEFIPFGAKDPIKLNLRIIQNLVAVKTKSGRTCSEVDALNFMVLCQSQHLDPFVRDCYLVGYDLSSGGAKYSMIVSHIAYLKRAEMCPDYEGMESGVILKNQDGTIVEREGDFVLPDESCVGGWAKVYRKGRRPTYRRLSIAAMKPKYDTDFWNVDKAPGQVCKCAESQALRDTFPTLVGGLSDPGVILDVTTSAVSVGSGLVATSQEPGNVTQLTQGGQPAAVDAEKTTIKTAPATELTPQQQVANLVSNAGCTFDQFKEFVKAEYTTIQIDSAPSFDDLRTQDAKNFVRAKDGMIAWLKEKATK